MALAHTENTAGPGINAQYTIIEIKPNFKEAKPVEVLDFDEGAAKVRDLKMDWRSSELHITYRGDAVIIFQAVKAIGQDISVERLND